MDAAFGKFLIGIPKDLEEAAMVDGSTRLGVFLKILLPLMGPGLVATRFGTSGARCDATTPIWSSTSRSCCRCYQGC